MIECHILTTELQIQSIAVEWRHLWTHLGRSLFTGYDLFSIWWNAIGKTNTKRMLHVVAGYTDGKLVAILPLTVMHWRGMRIMQAAGFRAYNYCDMLAHNEIQAAQLWAVARQSPHYDFADIRDVYPESQCFDALKSFARRRDLTNAYSLQLKWSSGEEWFATKSNHTRSNFKRCVRRMEEKGALRFEVYQGGPLPTAIIEDMVKKKVDWSFVRNKRGLFQKPGVLDYNQRLIKMAAEQGSLFLGWLSCGDKVIAYNQCFVHDGVLQGMLLTHDPAWSRYSPGNAIQIYTIFWAIEHGLKSVDFRQGENMFKTIFANDVRQCAEFTFNNSLRGLFLEKIYMMVRIIKRMATSHREKKRPKEK